MGVTLTSATTTRGETTRALPSPTSQLVGDGTTLNTAAFNATIDRLAAAGGGTLTVPAGRYLTGTIYLKSGVTLHLDNGAVIVGSTNLADYPRNPPPFPAENLLYGRYAVVCALQQHDVAITGEGKIFGQGSDPNFSKKILQERGLAQQDAYLNRPYGLYFHACRRVQVRNITLQNLAYRTQLYLACDDVVVDGVTVDSRKDDCNNDGLDLDGSRDVRIANCDVAAGDDGITLKSSWAACENVTINNCVIHALCNGIKFGAASRGGYKNVSISNCAIYETGVAGIAMEVVDGGVLDGVTVSNLTMSDVSTPIFIRLGNRGEKWIEGQSPAAPGVLRNVTISNVTAAVFARDGTMAASITGLPEHPVENITLSQIIITLQPGHGKVPLDNFQLTRLNAARIRIEREFGNDITRLTVQDVPERPADYPEYSMFGPLPAYGFFCRHVKGLTLDRIDLAPETMEHRSAVVLHDVQGVTVAGWRSPATPQSNPVFLFRDVTDALLTGCVAQGGTRAFLRVEGDSDHITLLGSDLSRAASAISLEDGLSKRHIRVLSEPNVSPATGR